MVGFEVSTPVSKDQYQLFRDPVLSIVKQMNVKHSLSVIIVGFY